MVTSMRSRAAWACAAVLACLGVPAGASASTFLPGITISVPVDGAHYPVGPPPVANYSCTNPTIGPGVVSCLGPVASGSPIDTSSPGVKTFTVTARTGGGQTASATVTYTVDAPPLAPLAPAGLNSESLGRGDSSPALSHDGRISRYAAYVSGGNVFVVRRARPWTLHGSPWRIGATRLVTRGLGGAAADGPSASPVFSGNDFLRPRCLAFVSSATNLVPGDTDGHADVFILGLSSGRLRRVATPGPASEVSVDARCDAYAYVAGGTLYVRGRDGRTRRESAIGGVSHPQLSYSAKQVVFERDGVILYRRVGGGQRSFGPGTNPTADQFGRYIAFERAGSIYIGLLRGGQPQLIGPGVSPAMTSGGHAVLYGQGPVVRLSTKKLPVASCPSGNVVQVSTSPHGNYVEFTCTDGGVYLGYVGPQFK